jgi:hypothetical protein
MIKRNKELELEAMKELAEDNVINHFLSLNLSQMI